MEFFRSLKKHLDAVTFVSAQALHLSSARSNFAASTDLMKKLLFLALSILISSISFAQDDEIDTYDEDEDLFEISTPGGGGKDRLILEFNWNYWLNTPDSFNIQGKSRGFNFYFFYDIALGTDNFSLAPGFGLGNSNIFHESFLQVNTDENDDLFGTTEVIPFADTLDYKKNKISLTYFEIPVELRFRTNPNNRGKRFKIAAGFKAGLGLNYHTKYIGTDTRATALPGDTEFVKYKEHRVKNIESFRYGVTGRIGYGNINLHAFYGLSNVFEDGQGPTANALSVGISFNSF